MFPSSLRSYGGKRKDSAIRTLVAETLVLAKTHGCVEKIESELEEELRRDSKGLPTDPLSKWRRKGDKALKSKYVLLTVALFCVTDCALVLGELILDLHKVKDTLETSERAIRQFKLTLHEAYPTEIQDVEADIKEVFDKIVRSRIIWYNHRDNSSSNSSFPSTDSSLAGNSTGLSPKSSDIAGVASFSSSSSSSSSVSSGFLVVTGRPSSRDAKHARGARSVSEVSEVREYVVVYDEIHAKDARKNRTSQVEALPEGQGFSSEGGGHGGTGEYAHGKDGDHKKGHVHSLEEEVAHALHMVSISMMACLVFETLLKAFCAGLPFFKRRLETFDFFIVIVSFVVDLAFMQILPRFKIQDFVFILAFLLPWRVIRVVNSLVVAVQDHEHFRLKLVYSRKKKIQNSLRETEVKLQLFRAQCCALKRLCINEGVEEAKIEQIVQLDEYVVNKTGKSKCKVKIDNSSVILLDKSDFPRLSPRPSLSCLVEKRRSMQVEGGRGDGKCDKSPKKSALKDSPLRRGTLALVSSAECLKKDQAHLSGKSVPQTLFSNGPRKRRWNLLGLGRDGTVKRAGSFSQICMKPAGLDGVGDLLTAHGVDGKVKRAGSHSLLCGSSAGVGAGMGHLDVSMEERDEDDVASSLALAASPDDSLFIVDELALTQVKDDKAREVSSATHSPAGSEHTSYLPSPAFPKEGGGSFNPNLLYAPEFSDTFTDVSTDKVHNIEKASSLPHLEVADRENIWVDREENSGDGAQRETHPSVFDRGKQADDVVRSGNQDADLVEGQVTFALSFSSNVSAAGESFESDNLEKSFEIVGCQVTEEETTLEGSVYLSRALSEVCNDSTQEKQTSCVELTSIENGIYSNGLLQDVKTRDPEHAEMAHVPVRACERSHSSEDEETLGAAREYAACEEDHAWTVRPEPEVAILDVSACSSTVRTETRMQNGFSVSSSDSVDQVIQTNGLPHMYK